VEPNAWIDVDQKQLQANARALLRHFSSVELIAVVKANGYGHDLSIAARAFSAAGVGSFAVTTLDEALILTQSGASWSRILVFAPVATLEQARCAVLNGFETTVCAPEHLNLLLKSAAETGRAAKVHLKIDTGMGRLGVLPSDALSLANLARDAEGVEQVGIYTHFAKAADKSLSFTRQQLRLFEQACDSLANAGIAMGIRHAANSAAALRLPESQFDAVRIGTALYGQAPSRFVALPPGVSSKTWHAKARVIAIRDLPAGATVGYGSEAVLKRDSRLAILAVGFADGFGMAPSSLYKGRRGFETIMRDFIRRSGQFVTIRGRKALVVGRIAMQMTAVDITGQGDIHIGDEAVVPMRRLAASALLPRRQV